MRLTKLLTQRYNFYVDIDGITQVKLPKRVQLDSATSCYNSRDLQDLQSSKKFYLKCFLVALIRNRLSLDRTQNPKT